MKSDSDLQRDVIAELTWWPNVQASHIGVTAENGVVTLTGQVEHYVQKNKAEKAAKAVYGVQGIANDIVVEPAGTSNHTDHDIAEAALHAMKWNAEVPNDMITLVVKKGWVHLDGKVDWQFEKDAAARCVHFLTGVKGVINSIVVTPTAKWTDVTNKIEEAFRRSADLEARRISVHTHAGKVTLAGNVASWSERTEAAMAAWSAPGVTSVINDLVVSV